MTRFVVLLLFGFPLFAAEHVQFGTTAGGDLSGSYPNPFVTRFTPTATYYIQNTLTPTTTTQMFSVQLGTATDSFTIGGEARPYLKFNSIDNTDPVLELYDAASGSPGGSVDYKRASGDIMAQLKKATVSFEIRTASSTNITPVTRIGIFDSNFMYFSDKAGNSIMTVDTSTVTLRSGYRFFFNDESNSNYIGLRAPSALGGSTLFVLPDSDGSSGQSLLTDGSGNLYFDSVSGGAGGASTLAVTTGTTSGFSSVASSPTAVINADQAMFGVSLQGSATAFFTLKHTVTSVTANLVLTSTHSVVLADATGGGITVTLPTAVGISGRIYTVKRTNSGANTVTINTTSAQTIDGDSTAILSVQHTSVDLVSDGANWRIL